MIDPNDDFSSDLRGDYGSKPNRTAGIMIVAVALVFSALVYFLWTRNQIADPAAAAAAADPPATQPATTPSSEPEKASAQSATPTQKQKSADPKTKDPNSATPSLSDRKTRSDPKQLATAVANQLAGDDPEALIENLKTANLSPEKTERLKSFVEEGNFELAPDSPVDLVGRVDGKTRFALDLSRPATGDLPAEKKRVFVDVQKNEDGSWEIADLSLPAFTVANPDTAAEKKVVTVPSDPGAKGDAMNTAYTFFEALTSQDFASARAQLDPKRVSEEKLAGLFIVTEDGQFKPHGENPLIATSTGKDHAVIIAQLSNDNTTSDFGLQLQRDTTSNEWRITDIALSKLISELAKASDADGLPYTPVVTNPQGGESLVIYFSYDTPELHERATRQLEIIAAILKSDPAKTIEINGHADARGPEDYNVNLSNNRAASVKDQLIALKVDPAQIITKAFGEANPSQPNLNPDGSDNPDGRKHNRRAEVYLNF
ncbi:MAG: OmpA family protein [Verrucomicrobiota bacterium]